MVVGAVVLVGVVAGVDALRSSGSENDLPTATGSQTGDAENGSPEREIERTANRWALLFGAGRSCNRYMTQLACEQAECERAGGRSIPNCIPLSSEFLASFAGATVEGVVVRGDEAGVRFSNGETVEFDTRSGWVSNISQTYDVLDGEVTFSAAPPWEVGFAGPWGLWLDDSSEERVHVLADPLPIEAGCRPGVAPADTEALARSIRSDPDLEATEPVAVTVGGMAALRMDVLAVTGASVCPDWEGPGVVRETGGGDAEAIVVEGRGHRMRLHLLDLPRGSSARILAIAVVAPEARFEAVVDAAAPIMDSFEFHAG